MNSTLKPVLSQQQAGGQASPAKANVATANHTVALPQGAQNSHHGSNNIVGQNLTHHSSNTPQLPTHSVPSMAPVTANMVQMAQNMSNHGNLSSLNTAAPPISAAPSPNKPTGAPLSLVAEKPVVNASQPLALTRTPEKKEPDSTAQTNGTESPKIQDIPAQAKSPNEPNKNKQDTSKILTSPTKPPEKAPVNLPSTPQKKEAAVPVTTEGPCLPKFATANEPTGKSPAKPCEPKLAPTADVAPTQSNSKLVPESAKDSQDKAPSPQKPEATTAAAIEPSQPQPPKVEDKKEEPKVDKPEPKPTEEKETPKPAVTPVKEELSVEKNKNTENSGQPLKDEKQEEPVTSTAEQKQEEKKVENKTPAKAEVPKATPKSALKLATVTTPVRKRRQTSPSKADGTSSAKKSLSANEAEKSTPDSRAKRNRTKVQLYQSPTPELTMATKLSASAGRSTPTKQSDDKLIVFYKNEFLAVRNAEGGFYVCQAVQNVYRSTRKIKIRWLSQDKAADPSGETYKPDFYDTTDMECVLTTLSLQRAPGGGGAQLLKPAEQARANSILQRAIKAESGDNSVDVTEEHPDGLDLSLYKDESQLEKKGRKRGAKSQEAESDSDDDNSDEEVTPSKHARQASKRSPKSAKKAKPTPPKSGPTRKQQGSSPQVAPASKTATAVTEKAGKSTPAKKTPAKAKPATPAKPAKSETPKKAATPAAKKAETPKAETTPSRARRAAKEPSKPTPPVSTRTPRKPPAK